MVRWSAALLLLLSSPSMQQRAPSPFDPIAGLWTAPRETQGIGVSDSAVARAMKTAYLTEFGEVIPYPAVFNDERAKDCLGNGHAITTAYFRKSDRRGDLLTIYTSRDGDSVVKSTRLSNVLLPAGTIRVLSIVVHHPETVGDDALANWSHAQ